MMRVVAHKSAAAAQQYYTEGLKREDYYSEGQEVAGKWHGKAAALLGLSGTVEPEAFAALVENRHPLTGERLTPRTKADRTVGYDINFHSPKSLSILYGLTGDKEILAAFRSAVAETMHEIEAQAETRVRRGGSQGLRPTGNLAWAEFVHFTARPVGGIPDPHLHIHAFAFNATFDQAESRWKAAMFRQIKEDAPYHEAAFHSRLSIKIRALGYGVDRTKFGWEVTGIPRTLIEKFSRRSAQIEEVAAARGIIDPKEKDALAAATREGKRKGLSKMDLFLAWGARLTEQEKVLIAKVHGREAPRPQTEITAKNAVDHAIEKFFERNSVVSQNRLVSEALRFGVGQVTPAELWQELGKRDIVARKVDGEVLCTTMEVLAEEVSLVNFVRDGRGKHSRLGNSKIESEKLSAEQTAAVRLILNSRDQVIAVRGAAGVGKTTLMKQAVARIEAEGTRVFAFAPSADASRGTLRQEGFANAETVAHLLLNKKLQEKIRGQVIWIDEAGLLGTRELWQVMKMAGPATRVILTGDSQQHAPVARGDGFRLLQRYSGLKIAEVTEIRRQEGESYKRAVAALSKGDLRTGFMRLDNLGAVVEIKEEKQRYTALAQEYLSLSRRGGPPLVVSPTHAEGAKVVEAIREAKKEAGQIKAERAFVQYRSLRWELAERKRPENYTPGLLVQFHQNDKGIRRGELFRVKSVEGKEVLAERRGGGEVKIPLLHASRFEVFEQAQINLAKGDEIRITQGGKSADGRRLNNGNTFQIKSFTKTGDIVLSTGATLDKGHGHLAYGYCQTSHSSQSKSVKDVLVAQSEESFVASSREQFYVSVSRGKSTVRIFTDNRTGLQEAVGNSSTRVAGIELARLTKHNLSAMSTELNSKQWREVVRSRMSADGLSGDHLKNLLKHRRQDTKNQVQETNWPQYVAMKKALAGPDGKARSKGQPSESKGRKTESGRSFLRPTELRTSTKEKVAQKLELPAKPETKAASARVPEKKTAPLSKKECLVGVYETAARNLSKALERVKNNPARRHQEIAAKAETQATSQVPQTKTAKTQSTIQQVAKHAANVKAAQPQNGGMRTQKQPEAVKAKAPAPPPPRPKK